MSDVSSALVLKNEDIWSTDKPKCASCIFLKKEGLRALGNDHVECVLLRSLNKMDVWNSETNNGDLYFPDKNKTEFICSVCPLKSVPRELEIVKARYPQPDGYHPLYKLGWNDCIKAIKGEMINHPSNEFCESYLHKVSDDVVIGTENIRQKCEGCGSEHFSMYLSEDNSPVYVCNECKAVYIVEETKENEVKEDVKFREPSSSHKRGNGRDIF